MGAQWKAKGKAQAADARGKLFGRLAKDIMIAARNGADPAANSRLRLVVEQARRHRNLVVRETGKQGQGRVIHVQSGGGERSKWPTYGSRFVTQWGLGWAIIDLCCAHCCDL